MVLDGKLDIKIAAASSGMTEQEFEAEMEKMKREIQTGLSFWKALCYNRTNYKRQIERN